MNITAESVWSDILAIRNNPPLVHNITNYVAMTPTANALLALGASPVMAHAEAEVADMVSIAGALVINIGTLSPPWIRSMKKALIQANRCGVPVVLDPVGAGATRFRTQTARKFLSAAPVALIRGNASEIMALGGTGAATRGVDSLDAPESAIAAARKLNRLHRCAVCISGETDYIVFDEILITGKNGHSRMALVTGMGCTASAVCGAFLAVNPSPVAAAAHAVTVMGVAGEMAAERSAGPGSMHLHFLDALHAMGADEIAARIRVDG